MYTTGVYPQATYGMEGVGYCPWAIRTLRTMAAGSMGCSKKGRCPITAIVVAKGIEWDPDARGPTQLIKQWAAFFPRIEPGALTEAWANMKDNLEAAGAKPWARVKGPMGATYLHLKEMGCSAQREPLPSPHMVGLAESEGNNWKFNNAISWHDFHEKNE